MRAARLRLARSLRPGNARWLLLGAYAALGTAWLFSDPPFSSPDEEAHYVRAIGVSQGSLVGSEVQVPVGLSPDAFSCEIKDPAVSAACTLGKPENPVTEGEFTAAGLWPPLPYVLPAIALRAGSDATSALRLARLATLAVWLALLAAAIAASWDGDAGLLSLAGLVVALTPMVVFVGASLTDSSDEVLGSIVLTAALLRVLRGGTPAPRWVWWIAGAAGFLLALTRQLSPLWIGCIVLTWLALAGRAGAARALRSGGRSAIAAATMLALGVVLGVAWDIRYQTPGKVTALPSLDSLRNALHSLRLLAGDLVGNFGYLNVPLGAVPDAAWAVGLAALVVLAGRVAARRGALALLLALLLAVLVPALLDADVIFGLGFGVQARDILPLIVLVPLLAGELVREHRDRLPAPLRAHLCALVLLIAAAVQLTAWWADARRYAVGDHGPLWFLASAQWSPPVAWGLWLALVLLATGVFVLLAVRALAAGTRERGAY